MAKDEWREQDTREKTEGQKKNGRHRHLFLKDNKLKKRRESYSQYKENFLKNLQQDFRSYM